MWRVGPYSKEFVMKAPHMLYSNYVFCVLISLQSCEDEEGGLCEVVDCCLLCFHGRGSFGEHLMSHAHWPNVVVVGPLLGEMPLCNDTREHTR